MMKNVKKGKKSFKKKKVTNSKKLDQRKNIIIVILFWCLLGVVLFKFYPFGYIVEHKRFSFLDNKLISIGKPKFSFDFKANQGNITYKNMRNKNVLDNEVQFFVSSLEPKSCNGPVYYYDKFANVTITSYRVEKRFLYNLISYQFVDGNYCNKEELKWYNEQIGLNEIHKLYAEEDKLAVNLYLNGTYDKDKNEYKAWLKIYYRNDNGSQLLESSTGIFEIKNSELIYRRDKIEVATIEVPNVSKFVLKNKKLILEDNYLVKYKSFVVIK